MQYGLQKIAGKNQMTTLSWDLDDCIFKQVAGVMMNKPICTGKTVKVRLGSTSWWKGSSSVPWLYLNKLPQPAGMGTYQDPATLGGITSGVQDDLSANVQCCDGATDPNNCNGMGALPVASDFTGMTVTAARISSSSGKT